MTKANKEVPGDLAKLIHCYTGPGVALYAQTQRGEKSRLPRERLEELVEEGWLSAHDRSFAEGWDGEEEEIAPEFEDGRWWNPGTGDEIPAEKVYRSYLTLPAAHETHAAKLARLERLRSRVRETLDEIAALEQELGIQGE